MLRKQLRQLANAYTSDLAYMLQREWRFLEAQLVHRLVDTSRAALQRDGVALFKLRARVAGEYACD